MSIREVVLTFNRGKCVKAVASLVSKDGSLAVKADRIGRKTIIDNDGTWRATAIEFGGTRTEPPEFKIDIFEKRISDH